MISLSKLSSGMNQKPLQRRKDVQLRLSCFLALSKDSSMACWCTAWGQVTWICIFLFLDWFVPSTRRAFIVQDFEHFYDVLWFCIGNFGNGDREKKNTGSNLLPWRHFLFVFEYDRINCSPVVFFIIAMEILQVIHWGRLWIQLANNENFPSHH